MLKIKEHLKDYLPEEAKRSKNATVYLWRDVIWVIWGKDSENGGKKIMKAAPAHLREIYEQIFH